MKLAVRYCGGCRSEYDRVHWVGSLLDIMAQDGFEVLLTEPENADAVLTVCGCLSRCVDVSPGTYIICPPFVNGKRMGMEQLAAFLKNSCSDRKNEKSL